MKILIFGAGKIGLTLKAMLVKLLDVTQVSVADKHAGEADFVIDLEQDGEGALRNSVRNFDAVISALPFHLNKRIAEVCVAEDVSYFDFTEDTDTTAYIQALAKQARVNADQDSDIKAVMVPQCGLAPGAINIIGASFAKYFDKLQTLDLRVGALPQTASNEMQYYLTWSSAGLVNEYLQPCDALYQGKPIKTMPLDGLETVIIDGVTYEAFNTSGGVATMCETFKDKIDSLSYKTLRYPGHRDHMKFVIDDLGLGKRQDLLTEIFDQNVPAIIGDDVVLIYVNAVGIRNGKLVRDSYIKKVRAYEGFHASAIQSTTAAGMAAVVELWIKGKLKDDLGFVRQEDIDLDDFLNTKWGRLIYG